MAEVGRPQQVVLELRWTEDGRERPELFGPWAQGDPETEEGGLSHMLAAHRFVGDWHRVTGASLSSGDATVIVVNDPEEWLRAQRERAESDRACIERGMVSKDEAEEMRRG